MLRTGPNGDRHSQGPGGSFSETSTGTATLDAVVANTGGDCDRVYTWNSANTFVQRCTSLTGPTGTGTTAVALGDFDGDGDRT